MSFPRLSQRVADAHLTPAVARTFADTLREIVVHDRDEESTKLRLIDRVMGDVDHDAQPAPFEALWPHAELLVTVCIYVAVTDGRYGVEEARHISQLAHRLGMSARQIERLEARVFDELKERADQSGAAAEAADDEATQLG